METKQQDPGGSQHKITPLAPHHSSDDAAHDEPKTYCHEQDDPWQDQDTLHSELENVKGDLVQQGDHGEDGQSNYDGKSGSSHSNDSSQRRKSSDRDIVSGGLSINGRGAIPGLPGYNPDLNPLINSTFPASNFPSLPLAGLGPVTTYPYSPYHPHINPQYLLQQATSQATAESKALAGMAAQQMYSLPGQLGQIPNPLVPWNPAINPYATSIAVSMSQHLRMNPLLPFSSAGTGLPNFPAMLNPQGSGLNPSMLPHPTTLGLQMPSGHGLPQNVPKSANNIDKMLQHHHGGDGGNNPMMHHPVHHGNHHLGHMMHNGGGPHSSHGNHHGPGSKRKEKSEKPDRPYVKKPLNAFMLYMKEQRQKVVAECTLKESAAINQILGRKWHSLGREEQQVYYDKARKARQLHMEKFPGWSARDNYGKRKKRKKEKTHDCTAQTPKKCRAVYGLESQNLWCAPCRRKKKCVRYKVDGDDSDIDDSDSSPMNMYQVSPVLPPQPVHQQGGQQHQANTPIFAHRNSDQQTAPQVESMQYSSPSITPGGGTSNCSGGNSNGTSPPMSSSGNSSQHSPTNQQKMCSIKREQRTPPNNQIKSPSSSEENSHHHSINKINGLVSSFNHHNNGSAIMNVNNSNNNQQSSSGKNSTAAKSNAVQAQAPRESSEADRNKNCGVDKESAKRQGQVDGNKKSPLIKNFYSQQQNTSASFPFNPFNQMNMFANFPQHHPSALSSLMSFNAIKMPHSHNMNGTATSPQSNTAANPIQGGNQTRITSSALEGKS